MAEEIIFNARVNTGKSANDLSKLEQDIQAVGDAGEKISSDVSAKLTALNEKIEKGGLTVRQYTKAVREYQAIALEAGRTSPVGEEALRQAGQLQDEMQDLRNEVTRLGQDGRRLQAALQLGSTITAGYGAVQGAMALVGAESEDLQKTMVKLQAATALLNGLEQIRTALEKESMLVMTAKEIQTKVITAAQYAYTTAVGTTTGAMKILRIAMLAIPALAIIAAITAIVVAVVELSSSTRDLAKENDNMTASFNRARDAMDRMGKKAIQETENRIKLRKAQGASEQELHDLEIKRLNQQETIRKADLKTTESVLSQKQKLYKDAKDAGDNELAKTLKDEIQTERKRLLDLKQLNGQHKAETEILNAEFSASQKEKQDSENKENLDKAKEYNAEQKRLQEEKQRNQEEAARQAQELERTITDLSIANMKEGDEKRRVELSVRQERERQDLIEKYGQNTELLKQLEINQTAETTALADEIRKQQDEKEKADAALKLQKENDDKKLMLEAKMIAMRDDFDATQSLREELALLEYQQAMANTELSEAGKLKIYQDYQAKIADVDKARRDSEKSTNDAIAKSRLALAGAVADVFGKLAGIAKEGSAAQKAFAITELGINTAIGFINGLRIAQQAAIATGPGAGLAFPIFFAQQTAAVIAAASQAKKILGSSVSVPAPTSSSASGGPLSNQQSGQSAPQDENQGTATSGLQNNATRVFVLDYDITESQEKSQRANAIRTVG